MGKVGFRKISIVALLLAPLLALSWVFGVSRCGVAQLERDWEANSLLKVCAKLGHANAEAYLGMLYISSAGYLESSNLEPDLSEAEARKYGWDLLLSAADKKGGGSAANEIGSAYLRGRFGVAEDAEEARIWIARATRDGDEIAPLNFARIYAGGLGVQPDLETSLTFLTISADRGYRPAQCYLSKWKEISNEASDTADSLERLRALLENERAGFCARNDPVSKFFRLSKRSVDQAVVWARSTYRNIETERNTKRRIEIAKKPDENACAVYRDFFVAVGDGTTPVLRPDTLSYHPFVRGEPVASPRMFYRETGETETVEIGGGKRIERPKVESFEFDTSSMYGAVSSSAIYSVQDCFTEEQPRVKFWSGSFDRLYAREKSASDDDDMSVTSVMFWAVSPVGISEDDVYALIYAANTCGMLCGAGGFYLLKYDDGLGWSLFGYYSVWVS